MMTMLVVFHDKVQVIVDWKSFLRKLNKQMIVIHLYEAVNWLKNQNEGKI